MRGVVNDGFYCTGVPKTLYVCMYKLYFPTVKTWLQKVIFPRAIWLVKVSINIYIYICIYSVYNNNKVIINSN